jgi:hypothetical protein
MSIDTGYKFGVYGADSTGEVVDTTPSTVSYRFDHAPEVVWGRKRDEFMKITFPVHAN